ncbi:2-oxoglutarate dehydrogenase complex dihydrolipoyllysine-residue succinyltransferase [Verrucomicrobiales bacterium]|jgi:2-oxoglutarate dehydrogenase E2 component (dihydrolipoamide succinyltransferase)|nr:2-oxoglutarate dehydrogenase complex dihydrolipoyllysine-residue succinyltransferase [Verrucomicrobiales bacterium]MDB4359048.1 2-oxoglutarate dehydrogenase complex dihydrolipoyllysine-residue succinyltransferase [Verrucomicrobiales bacterium]
MSHEIKIPSVGESITSATLAAWAKADGAYVKAGEEIVTLDTDKVSTPLEASHDGILKHLAAEGDELDIGAVIASIEEGDAPAETAEGTTEAPAESQPEKAPAVNTSSSTQDVKATPVARKIADDEGVDLSSLKGTGVGGKVTKSDVLGAAAKEEAPAPSAAAPARSSVTAGEKPVTRKKMSPLRRKIATHLVNAQHDAAILTTFNECDMTEIMNLRKRIQEDFVARHGVKLGFMSFFIKAVVDALQAVPSINAQLEGDELVENHFYDIGVAVGTDKGLMVPVVRDCDQKSFAEIEQDIIDYALKARDGKIGLDDLQGGVFTITNGGIYGSLLSTPILNPPQSGILGMHSIQQRPIALNGEVVIRPMMYLALSYDHRIVDGKEAVTFLVRVKDCLENPERMLVGA